MEAKWLQANDGTGAMSDADLRKKARKRAEDMVGFYIHFTCYLAVNIFLFLLWAFTNVDGLIFPWPIFTAVGWGVGIIFHFFAVFGSGRMQDKLEEEEYQRMKRMQGGSQ